MPTVKDIFLKLCDKMPLSLCATWDNSGFLLGSARQEVKKVLLALDVTQLVVSEAVKEGCSLIVTHHPLIREPMRSITDETKLGKILLNLIKNDISVISMHSNADTCAGGINDILAEKLKLKNIESARCGQQNTLGRLGELEKECSLRDFLERVKKALYPLAGARYHDAGRPVKKIAVFGGACGEFLSSSQEFGCDTFLTSDIKYSVMLEASEIGMNIIDAGHFETETIVNQLYTQVILDAFRDVSVKISETNSNPVTFYC